MRSMFADNTKGKHKVSIDLDGTFFEYPKEFSQLGNDLQAQGHKVGILTGRFKKDEAKDRKRLRMYGFTPDFFINRDNDKVDTDHTLWKAQMINYRGIDVHFDDEGNKIKSHGAKGLIFHVA